MINKIIVKNESRDVFPEREVLGITGENKFETLQFNLDNFIDGEALLRVERKETNGTAKYEIAVEKGDNCYTLEVLSSLLAYKGTVKLQLVIMQENLEVFKSKYFNMKVLEAIEVGEEIPEQYPTWQQLASQKIIEIDSKLEEVTALEEDLEDKVESGFFKGQDGEDGQDGKDATINGYNSIELVAGENIRITQVGNQIIISATGVTPPTPTSDIQYITSDNMIFLTSDNLNFIVKENN